MTVSAPLPFRPVTLPHPLPAPGTPLHEAADLTGPGGIALIRLGAQVYTLRITRAGKLILTK